MIKLLKIILWIPVIVAVIAIALVEIIHAYKFVLYSLK
jgi:hypothetical protein